MKIDADMIVFLFVMGGVFYVFLAISIVLQFVYHAAYLVFDVLKRLLQWLSRKVSGGAQPRPRPPKGEAR